MKKWVAVMLSIIFLLSLVACGISLASEDISGETSAAKGGGESIQSLYEMKAIANDLIFRADMLYQLFYGSESFREYFDDVVEIEDDTGAIWLMTPQCRSIEQLKSMAQKVFAKEYCQLLFKDVFESDYNKFKYIDSALCESTQVGGIGNANSMLMATMKIIGVNNKQIVLQLMNALPPDGNVETQAMLEAEIVWEDEQWVLKSYPLKHINNY